MLKQLLKTFLIFCKIGLITFGGGYAILPILQAELVEKRQWLSEEKLADLYAAAQCQPGIIAVNVAVLIVGRKFGRPAAIAAAVGVCLPSFIIILIIATLLTNFQEIPAIRHALAGIKVVVAAMMVHITWRMLKNGVKDIAGAVIFAAALFLLTFNLVSAVFIIIGGGVCGILLFLIRRRKGGAA